jgi:hypothetical protein
LQADAVIAHVGLIPQGHVGLDGIEPLLLQGVGFDFFGQADAAAFLRQINQHAGPFAADHVQRHLELLAAIAAQRAQQIAGETAGMNPHQRRR